MLRALFKYLLLFITVSVNAQEGFAAYTTSGLNNATGDGTNVIINTWESFYDSADTFDGTSWLVEKSGMYNCNVGLRYMQLDSNHTFLRMRLVLYDGVTFNDILNTFFYYLGQPSFNEQKSITFQFNEGDEIYVEADVFGDTVKNVDLANADSLSNYRNVFSCFLIYGDNSMPLDPSDVGLIIGGIGLLFAIAFLIRQIIKLVEKGWFGH